MILGPAIKVIKQRVIEYAHSAQVYGGAYGGLGEHVVQCELAQYIEAPQVRIKFITDFQTGGGGYKVTGAAVKAGVVKEFTLAPGEFARHPVGDGVVHQHVGQVGTQLESGLVTSGKELLIIARGHIACQLYGLVQMVADGIYQHLVGPPVNGRIDVIGRTVTPYRI